MSKFLVFCIIALAVLMTIPAYAEVQNVKVSGDLSARYLLRDDYSLAKSADGITGSADNYFISTAEVQVDADLTDNVSTVLRLGNQRNWGDPQIMRTQATAVSNFNIDVDLANVTLKELIYSPLTVKIGRQDLWFGRGFIIGAKQRDIEASISAKEYTIFNSFDAIRATLDFDPWKIDGVYSMIEEPLVNKATRTMLWGTNVGYKFDSYKGEAEAYFWRKQDESGIAYESLPTSTATTTVGKNAINTYGVRGSLEPVTNLNVAAELAIQGGFYNASSVNASRHRGAVASDLSGDYLFKDAKWSPKLGAEWIYYSGEKDPGNSGSGSSWHGWDPMYRGKFDTAIREFQNVYYGTSQRITANGSELVNQDSGVSNEHQFIVMGSVKPTNTIKLDGRFAWFRMARGQTVTVGGVPQSRNKDIGSELDVNLTYDYTEDVSFGVLAGWFFPGKYWISNQDDIATDLVGTVKVAF